ncbi:MAG: Si-specific NAD(P)(+) transhydrogenase [Bryobacteraceae bacterium]
MASKSYDLIVLGSGPAGEKGASTAAQFGKRVAMIEKAPHLGGASTNTGTIPSKTLRETALALSGLRARDLYGVDLSLRREATVSDFLFHESQVKASERNRIQQCVERDRIELVRGAASFSGGNTVNVATAEGYVTLEGERILVATGSSPFQPAEFCFPDSRVHDSDEILALDRLPDKLAVIGAGVIGSEYACTFAALGCEVHLLDRRDVILPFLDREMSLAFEQSLPRLGIRYYKNEKVTACVPGPPEGGISLECESGLKLEVDQVLVAAGRKSNTGDLNLSAAGVTTGERGLIPVNEFYQTNVPHIYAAGDVIGFPALAATSAEQARIAVWHAFQLGVRFDMSPLLPSGIYTIPEISMVGETEESLREKKIDYITGRASYADNARGEIIGDSRGTLKVLCAKPGGKVLGVHVIGELASEVVHVGLMAMVAGATVDIFNQACFNYPTLGDLYKTAAYDAMLKLHAMPGAPGGIVY